MLKEDADDDLADDDTVWEDVGWGRSLIPSDEFENLDNDDSDDCDDVQVADDDDFADVGEEDVGWAGLWQKPDPINHVHTCLQSQQESLGIFWFTIIERKVHKIMFSSSFLVHI